VHHLFRIAGALDAVDIIQVSNLAQFLRRSREVHDEYYASDSLLDPAAAAASRATQPARAWGSLCVLGLSANVNSVSCYNLAQELSYGAAVAAGQPFGVVLVLGSEGAGIAPEVAAACHMHVTIPGFGTPSVDFGRIAKRLGKNSPLRVRVPSDLSISVMSILIHTQLSPHLCSPSTCSPPTYSHTLTHALLSIATQNTSFKPLLDSLNVSSAAAIALHQLANATHTQQ